MAGRQAIDDYVREELAAFGPALRSIVVLAALLGTRIERDLLDACAGPDAASVDAALELACSAGLLRREPESGALRFRHALTQAAVSAALPAAERRALHVLIASTIERGTALPARFGQLAYHWARAGEPEIAQAYATLMAREIGRAQG